MKEGWEYKIIGSLCDIKTGKLDANAASPNGKYPFFTCSRETLKIDNYAYDCECVLVAGNGELNAKYYKGKFNAYQRTYIISLKPNTNEISTKYLYCFFSKFIETLRQRSVGGVIKYIKLGDLTNAQIPVPDYSRQLKIVEELDLLSSIIEKKKAQLKELDNLAQSLFYEMFGDPITNEKGWDSNVLENVVASDCSISYGIVQPGDDVFDGIPVVRPVDLISNVVKREGLKRVAKNISDSYRRTILKGGEILLCVRGTTGVMSFASDSLAGCNVTRGITPLSFERRLNRDYVFAYLSSQYIQDIIADNTRGATLKQINMKDVRKLPVQIPPLDLQNQFAEKVQAIEHQKDLIRQSIKEVETLFNSRMDYYFN